MNTFTLLAFIGGFGVIVSFFSGIHATARFGTVGHRCNAEEAAWRFVFYVAAFTTILAALLAG
jgi:hypothetical protein